MSQQVAAIMHAPLVMVEPTTSLRTVAAMLCRAGVGAVVVVEDDAAVGIVSERDLVRMVDAGADLDITLAADVIVQSVFWVTPHDSVAHAGRLMTAFGVRHLPVLRDSRPVGMVSIRDVLKAVLDPFSSVPVPPARSGS